MPAVGGFVFDSSGALVDREIRIYRRDTGALLGKTRSSGGDGDQHFDKVSLLLQPRTAGAVFADESTLRHSVAAVGQAKAVADAASPTGYSASFDGSEDWLQVGKSAAMVFGSGDFTVECRVTAGPAARDRALVDFFALGIGGWQVYLDSSGKPSFYENTPNSMVLSGSSSVANGVPHHIAFARQGGTLRLFVDGVLAGSVSNTKLHIDPGVDLYIGAQAGSRNINYDFDGKLASVRITKGVARYTASFSPPTEPFPDFFGPGRTLVLGEYYFLTQHTGEVNVVCLDDASAPLENDLILRTFPV